MIRRDLGSNAWPGCSIFSKNDARREKVRGILADINVLGQVDYFVQLMQAEPWTEFWLTQTGNNVIGPPIMTMRGDTVRAPPAVLLPQARLAQSARRTARKSKFRQQIGR